jgi:general secretion pathway protein G
MIPARRRPAPLARQLGVSAVQMLLGLCVASIVSMMAVPIMADQAQVARQSQAIADIGRIQLRAMKYQINNNGLLPDSLADMDLSYMVDPWGANYEYLNFQGIKGDGKKRRLPNRVVVNLEFDVYSRGPDGQTAPMLTCLPSHDDIVRVRDGAFVGPATEYTKVDKHVCPQS